MEYTQEMFEEDKRMSWYVFYKTFRMLAGSEFEEDMIEASILKLKAGREKFDSSRGDYGFYAFHLAKYAMIYCYKKIKKEQERRTISLDKNVNGESEDTFLDFLQAEDNASSLSEYHELNETIDEALGKRKKNNKNSKTKKILELALQRYTMEEIAKQLNITKQCVSLACKKTGEDVKKLLNNKKEEQENKERIMQEIIEGLTSPSIKQLAQYMMWGYKSCEIADKLKLPINVVEFYTHKINMKYNTKKKLEERNATALI